MPNLKKPQNQSNFQNRIQSYQIEYPDIAKNCSNFQKKPLKLVKFSKITSELPDRICKILKNFKSCQILKKNVQKIFQRGRIFKKNSELPDPKSKTSQKLSETAKI